MIVAITAGFARAGARMVLAGASGISNLPVIAHFHQRGATRRQRAFGERLRIEREKRSVPLARVVATTKIHPSLLQELERGELERWPKGIFRKSYFLDYLTAVGLPADPLLVKFLELFPDHRAAVACGDVAPGQAAVLNFRLGLRSQS